MGHFRVSVTISNICVNLAACQFGTPPPSIGDTLRWVPALILGFHLFERISLLPGIRMSAVWMSENHVEQLATRNSVSHNVTIIAHPVDVLWSTVYRSEVFTKLVPKV